MHFVVVSGVQVLYEGCPGTESHACLVREEVIFTQSQEDLREVVVQVLRNIRDLRDKSCGVGV